MTIHVVDDYPAVLRPSAAWPALAASFAPSRRAGRAAPMEILRDL